MKIEFIPGSEEISKNIPEPEPSKYFVPKWYKEIFSNAETVNIKHCIPFLDSLSHGYIQKTWCDIEVKVIDEKVCVSFDSDVPILSIRDKSDMPLSTDFYSLEFVWQRPWSVKLPDGFSGLVVHPLNRYELPFITLSGTVDFDKSIHAPIGNIPFYIKNNFIGIIPKGTPMFQIIPLKREEWNSEKKEYSLNFWQDKYKERGDILGFYKKKVWTKKHFN